MGYQQITFISFIHVCKNALVPASDTIWNYTRLVSTVARITRRQQDVFKKDEMAWMTRKQFTSMELRIKFSEKHFRAVPYLPGFTLCESRCKFILHDHAPWGWSDSCFLFNCHNVLIVKTLHEEFTARNFTSLDQPICQCSTSAFFVFVTITRLSFPSSRVLEVRVTAWQ